MYVPLIHAVLLPLRKSSFSHTLNPFLPVPFFIVGAWIVKGFGFFFQLHDREPIFSNKNVFTVLKGDKFNTLGNYSLQSL